MVLASLPTTESNAINGAIGRKLPLEIIREIFQYLPVPTNEIFGHGDGGTKRWKQTKELSFTIEPRAFDHTFFDQFESNEFHKIIQTAHPTAESFVDCYNRPPFFPDNTEVIIRNEDLSHFLTFGVAKKVRIRIGTLALGYESKICREFPTGYRLSKICLSLEGYFTGGRFPTFDSVSIEDDYNGLELTENHSLPILPFHTQIKELEVETHNWPCIKHRLPPALQKLKLVDNGYGDDLSDIDLKSSSIKSLTIDSKRPITVMKITPPDCLEELLISGMVGKLEMDYPSTLKLLTLPDMDRLTLPDTLEELDFIPTVGITLSHFQNLKVLTVDAQILDSGFVLKSLPPFIEELLVIPPIQIDVDFTKLPRLWKLTVDACELDSVFQTYTVDVPSLDNSLTFKFLEQTYSIPFTSELTSLSLLEIVDDAEIICYPQSLKYLSITGCGNSLLSAFPSGLKGLKLHSNYGANGLELPPDLDVLQTSDDYLNSVRCGTIKHLLANYTDLSELKCPKGLQTFVYVGNDTGVPMQEFWNDAQLTRLSLGIVRDPNGDLYESQNRNCSIRLTKRLRLFEEHCSDDVQLDIKDESDRSILRKV
ncbi:hypothetical protein CLIB1444_04S05534 [[Candida] jaroonii]|uniref:Uncharacterized protein n=1 Tax=[Candida] jaroonii TaxID=467808 RepID=A0ACA9Y708_9ASCO|nr:hypothetical protein CLIB1444_04S05534 [[Candida] jaroonii]